MDFLAENAIALVALLISTVLCALQLSTWRQGRHRTWLELQRMIFTERPKSNEIGEQFDNISYVHVRIKNVGKHTVLERLTFVELGGPEGSSLGISVWESPNPESLTQPQRPVTDRGFPPNTLSAPRDLADGETASWNLRITRHPPEMPDRDKPMRLRAVALLVDGRRIKSDVIAYYPAVVKGRVGPPPNDDD